MNTLYLDLETYSPVPIRNGVFAYAEKAEIMLVACAVNGEPVEVFDLTTPSSALVNSFWLEIGEKIEDADQIVIHNAGFDLTILQAVGEGIDVSKVVCTFSQALALGLPGSLADLCQIFNINADKSKSDNGKALINLFCKPRPKNSKLRRATRGTHPKEWKEFIEYARLDIEATRELFKRLPQWNYPTLEYDLWMLDRKINERGFAVDVDLATKALAAVEQAQIQLADRSLELSDGQLASTRQRDAMLRYVLDVHGVTLPDMRADTLERRLEDQHLPPAVRELIAVRLSATTSSTAKYSALLRSVSSDGRLRGTQQYCGASRTGRWSGRIFQPQNLPSKGLPPQDEIDLGVRALKAGIADLICPDVMQAASAAIRGCIIAQEGRKLVASDLANIEGRVAAWLTGETWKIEAFAAYDGGLGHDLYKLAYARAFKVSTESVSKDQRQIGKVMELALGYGGGVGAFITFAAVYGIDLDQMARGAKDGIPAEVWSEATRAYDWAAKQGRTYGLEAHVYCVCDSLKRMWRLAHPHISSSWKKMEDAVGAALFMPGRVIPCGRVCFRTEGAWLRMVLPSGRSVCYASPRVSENGEISYMGINQYSRKWSRIKTYGGKLFENACQAVARDVMADAMIRIENEGYRVILTVHDEVITEVHDLPEWNATELSALLCRGAPWTSGLPLAASGFEAKRYRKG